jgi:hypothetical protein
MRFGSLFFGFMILFQVAVAIAQLPSVPHSAGFQVTIPGFKVVWYYTGVNCASYLNDSGEDDWYYLVCSPAGSGRAIVEFTDVNSGYPIDSISVYLCGDDDHRFPDAPGDSHSPFELAIFRERPGSINATPLWGPHRDSVDAVPSQGGWVQFPIQRKLDSADSLYAQFRGLPGTPKVPLLAIDRMQGDYHTFGGYVYGNQVIWAPEYNGNLLIRLTYNLPDTLEGRRSPPNMPDSFSVYLADDSSAARSIEPAYAVIRDSLHLDISRSVGRSRYLCIAAWKGIRASARSTPLYLDPAAKLPFPLGIYPESLVVSTVAGQTLDREIIVSNPTTEDIQCAIHPSAGRSVSWLQYDTAGFVVAAMDSHAVSIHIDNSLVSDSAELALACEYASLPFQERIYRVVNYVDQESATADEPVSANIKPGLAQNFPNPFNSLTVIHSGSSASIIIYDLLGQVVNIVRPTSTAAGGYYRFAWDGCNRAGESVASGVYFYTQAGKHSARKMLLLK